MKKSTCFPKKKLGRGGEWKQSQWIRVPACSSRWLETSKQNHLPAFCRKEKTTTISLSLTSTTAFYQLTLVNWRPWTLLTDPLQWFLIMVTDKSFKTKTYKLCHLCQNWAKYKESNVLVVGQFTYWIFLSIEITGYFAKINPGHIPRESNLSWRFIMDHLNILFPNLRLNPLISRPKGLQMKSIINSHLIITLSQNTCSNQLYSIF